MGWQDLLCTRCADWFDAKLSARDKARDAARDAELLAPFKALLCQLERAATFACDAEQEAIDAGDEKQEDVQRIVASGFEGEATRLRACLPPEAEDSRKDKP
jgi:hypothetical protein